MYITGSDQKVFLIQPYTAPAFETNISTITIFRVGSVHPTKKRSNNQHKL